MERKNLITELAQKHSALFYSFLFLLGVLVAGLATLTCFNDPLFQNIYSNVVSNISAAFLVATLLYFLRNMFSVPEQEADQSIVSCQAQNVVIGSDICGLARTYDRMGNFGNQEDWIDLIDSSTEQVNIMGRSLYGWTLSSETVDVIVKKAKEGVKFRWLFMHEKNHFLPEIIEQDVNIGVQLTEKLRAVCKLIDAVHAKLPTGLENNFQVGQFTNAPLYFSILHVDDKVLVNHYLFSASSENSPLMKMKGIYQKWPRLYLKEFETIWKMSEEPVCNL